MSDAAPAQGWNASRSAAGDHNPWLVAVVVSIATFMVVLDTAIANVSLRYIAGHEDLDTDTEPAFDDPAIRVPRKRDPGPLFPWDAVLRAVPLQRIHAP